MEEAHKRYNNFIRSRLMMSEYEKKENIDIETIKRITGLTIKEIEKL